MKCIEKISLVIWLLSSSISISQLSAQVSVPDSLLAIFEEEKKDSVKFAALQNLGMYYLKTNYDSAILINQRLLGFAEEYIPASIPHALNNLGLSHLEKGDYELASQYFQRVIEESKRYPCKECTLVATGNLGIISMRKKEFEKSRRFARDAINGFWEQRDSARILEQYSNIALSFSQEGILDSAIYYYEEALELAQGLHSDFVGLITGNMGIIYYQTGDFQKSIQYYLEGYELSKKAGNKKGAGLAALNVCYSYIELDDFQAAINKASEALTILKEIGLKVAIPRCYEVLALAHENLGNYQEALSYQKSYQIKEDSINQKLYSNTIAEIEAKYEVGIKEAELAKKEVEIIRQKVLRRNLLLLAGLLILLISGLFQYLRYKQNLRRKETEFSLLTEREKAQQLLELDQLRSNFFANISHEFRTPLTLMLGPLKELISGTFKGNRKQYFGMMYRNGNRLLELINQMLDLSKLESGTMHLKLKAGDLGHFLRQLCSSYESWADRKEISYLISVPEDLPILLFDQDKIEKILSNLLSNALKFTPEEGSVAIEVTSISEKDKELMTIQISDTGIGIPEDELPFIFGRFYQSSKNEDGMTGTGIGLALTKELVELHGGTIEVASSEDKGSTFVIHLPLVPAKQTAVEKGNKQIAKKEEMIITPLTSNLVSLPKTDLPLLLVVEDNADLRIYISDQLSDEYQIILSNDGQAGFEKAVEILPDLVITDVMMPKLTGTELTRKLKSDERTSHIPVIMLTAKAKMEHKIEGLETGADDYLLKPFDVKELKVRIRNLIDQRKKLREHYSSLNFLSSKEIAATSVDEQFLKRLMEVIEEQIDNEELTIEELGQAVGMSRSLLHRKLKALTGQSPSVFLRTVRLHRAHHLLSKNAGNASEVAFMTGFSSIGYFSRCFKKQFDITPSEVLRESRI